MQLFRNIAIVAAAMTGSATVAQPPRQPSAMQDLNRRATAAIPEARAALDKTLTDYASARFQNIRARLVHSAYLDDEGFNKPFWMHRGGVVLVMCGEVNAKNRLGGYVGWQRFAFQPAQMDMVTTYTREPNRQSRQENTAAKPRIWMTGPQSYGSEYVDLLCGTDAQLIDPTELSGKIGPG